MLTNAPRKPNTKMKVAAKKASSAKKAAAATARPALGQRPAARHQAALPEVKSLTQELELERPAAPKAHARAVPSVSAASDPVGAPSRGSIRNRDIIVFLRQLIMMFEAGTPILKALKSLARRSENKSVRALVGGIAEYVEAGNPLWQAFAREGRYFDPVDVNLIKAAEASGSLPAVLKRIAEYRNQRDRLKRQMQVAAIYPLTVTVLSGALLILLSLFVLPAFKEMFDELGVKLNGYTLFIMTTAALVEKTWWAVVILIVGLVAAYRVWWVRNPLRQLQSDKIKLRLPVFGGLIRRRVVAEFSRTFAMLLRSGVSMMSTLDLCRNSVGNRAYIRVVQDMRDSIEAGEGLEAPLRKAEKDGYLDGVVVDMLLTGEESGGLEEVADQIATTYEDEIEIAVKGISEAILPIFVVFAAFVVGGIVIGVFLPLIQMIDTISSGQGL